MNLALFFPPWLSHIPIDWIVILVLVLIVSFDAMRSGSGRAAVVSLSLPISAYLFNLLSHTFVVGPMITSLSNPFVQGGVYLGVFMLTYILAYRATGLLVGVSSGLLFGFLTGIATTIVLLVTWLQVPALSAIWHLTPFLQNIFGAPYAILWLLAAFLILAAARG